MIGREFDLTEFVNNWRVILVINRQRRNGVGQWRMGSVDWIGLAGRCSGAFGGFDRSWFRVAGTPPNRLGLIGGCLGN